VAGESSSFDVSLDQRSLLEVAVALSGFPFQFGVVLCRQTLPNHTEG